MKLQQALNLFLAVDRAEQTRETYSKLLRGLVKAIGPNCPLELIEPGDIATYVNDMRDRKVKYADHPKRPPVEEKLSPDTIHKNIKTIKAFFNWCVKQHYIDSSPASFLINRRPSRPLGQGKAIKDKELREVLKAAQFKPRDRAIVLLLAYSGCRAGEAATLRIRNLDLDAHTAMVDGKGNKFRKIFYNQVTAEAIKAWLLVRPKTDHDYLFTSTRGHDRLTPRGLSQIIRRLSQQVGISRSLGSHSLRHRVGLTFGRKRVAPRIAQHYMGHSNVTTTLHYYQDVDETDLKQAGKLLEFEDEDDPASGD